MNFIPIIVQISQLAGHLTMSLRAVMQLADNVLLKSGLSYNKLRVIIMKYIFTNIRSRNGHISMGYLSLFMYQCLGIQFADVVTPVTSRWSTASFQSGGRLRDIGRF
jgi:hypothetical protein